jgi:hypothetical protein
LSAPYKIFICRLRRAVLLTLVLLPSFIFSQDLSKRISIVADQLPLEEVIRDIENKSGIYFSYSPQAIPVSMPVSIKAHNKTLRHILNKLFHGKDIGYEVVGNHIVLTIRGADPLPGQTEVSGGSKFTISGYLRDQAAGEPLIGAHIYENESFTGTATNPYGFYSLTLPGGLHRIVFSFLGYEKEEMSILLNGDKKLDVELRESALPMKEVEIIGRTDGTLFQSEQISEFRFGRKTISRLPGITGDQDIIKSLQVVPGVEAYGDGSSMFFVRGGGSDQNLILIDEVPVYNASHLFGFLSVISPDAINDMEVYKGDFPVKYGDRLSSVVDIKTKDGNMKRFGFGGNLGPYTSSLYLEGPVIRDKSSFYLAGRLSTLQWLPQLYFNEQDIRLGFVDLNAKLNFRLNSKNRLFGTFYIGNDLLERKTNSSIETFGLGWNNVLGTIRWNHVFSKKLFANTTFFLTRYQYLMYLSEDRRDYWNAEIATFGLKTDFTWYLNPRNTLGAGIHIGAYSIDAGNIMLSENNSGNGVREVPGYQCMEYAFYLGNQQNIGNRISLRYGLRFTVWQDLGPATVFFFNNQYEVIDTFNAMPDAVYASFAVPQPRISLTYLLPGGASVKAGYSRNAQFLSELTNSVSPFTSLAVWVPAGPNIEVRKADQYSLGYFTRLPGKQFRFSTEAYYKYYHDNIDYAPHANMIYNPYLEGELRKGDAWSYGLEMMVQKSSGRLTGWLGYTYSRVFVKSPGVNRGEPYRAYQDRPHHLTLFISYDAAKRWNLSANWICMSGAAITTPVGFYDYNGYVVPLYGEKNNDRLPTYHRLDLAAAFRLNKNESSRYEHKLIMSLYNAYGHTNPYFVSFNRVEDGSGDYLVPADQSIYRERIPVTLSVSEITPSLKYQFKF